jgi:hypothetical protein
LKRSTYISLDVTNFFFYRRRQNIFFLQTKTKYIFFTQNLFVFSSRRSKINSSNIIVRLHEIVSDQGAREEIQIGMLLHFLVAHHRGRVGQHVDMRREYDKYSNVVAQKF